MNEPNSSGSTAALTSETIKHLAYAEAAFMLIESLMLALVERGVFTVEDMLRQIDSVTSTKKQMISDDDHAEISAVAASMLTLIANSVAAVELNPR